MNTIKRKLMLFLFNYAVMPVMIIIGIVSLMLTKNVDMLGLFLLFGFASALWVLVQVGLTVGFVLLRKNIKTITPSIIITALLITLIFTQAVPYINPSLVLKFYSIAFLAYIIGTGYSYNKLKIQEFAKIK